MAITDRTNGKVVLSIGNKINEKVKSNEFAD